MLAALQAHSRAMFGLDGPDEAESSTQAQRRLSPTLNEDDGDEFQSDDGWGADDGFVSDSEDEGEDDDEDMDDLEVKMMKAVEPVRPRVVEVVDDSTGLRGNSDVLSKAEKRAFLVGSISTFVVGSQLLTCQNGNSAKMMGIKREADYVPAREQKRLRTQTEGGDDDDQYVFYCLLWTTADPQR